MTARQTEIPSAARIPVSGWFITNPVKQTSIEVRLVGKYDWKNAVKLEDNAGHEIITTPDRFASVRPETVCEKAEREKREKDRELYSKPILDALSAEKIKLSDLSVKIGMHPLAIINRINNWEQFVNVRVDKTPDGILLWRKS